MYKKHFALSWIKSFSSGEGLFRTNALEPFFEDFFEKVPEGAFILDIRCGWGWLAGFVKPRHRYFGVERSPDFFPEIKEQYPKKDITLVRGELPKNLGVKDEHFDIVVCALALNGVSELSASIEEIFSKAKPGGRVVIVDFNDAAEKPLRDGFIQKTRDDAHSVAGLIALPSGVQFETELFFHKDAEVEKLLARYGHFVKRKLGTMLIGYEIIKE